MGERRGAYKVFDGVRPDGKRHLEDPALDGRIIFRWIFKKWFGETWTVMIWLRIGTGGGLL